MNRRLEFRYEPACVARRERSDTTARRPLAGRPPRAALPSAAAPSTTRAGCVGAGRNRAGGLGGPVILRAIVGEEVVGRGLDEPGPYSMLEVLTPTMIDYARPELAAEMVPRLLSGSETWCQGFSEPGSGSDLASLTTRAEQRGDEWVVNGQKVWTSFAQYATRCVLLTRTGGAGYPEPRGNHRVLRRHGHPRHHRAARCARCTASTSSARCTSTTWWSPPTACSESPATAGNSRWICCPTNARPASGSASPTCTRGSTR